MWWQRSLALLCLCALSACGFEPAYKQRGSDPQHLLSRVAVQTSPQNREGQYLQASLEDALYVNTRSQPLYRLEAGLQVDARPFVISSDGLASRFNVTLTSPYLLRRLDDNSIVSRGTVRRDVSYNVSEVDDYSTFISERDAIERGVEALAEEYTLRVAAILSKQPRP